MSPVTAIKDRFKGVLIDAAIVEPQNVCRDRTRALKEGQDDFPTLNVQQGSLDALPNANTFDKLAFVLNLDVEIIDQDVDEGVLADRINELWACTHAALVPVSALNLPYVIDVTPNGAGAPSKSNDGAKYVNVLNTRFAIAFHCTRDPLG